MDDLPETQLVIHRTDLVLDEKSAPPVLCVSGSAGGSWPIPGIADSHLSLTAMCLAIADAGDAALKLDAKLEGTLAVGNSQRPVRSNLTEQATWTLGLTDEKQQVSLAQLISWTGGAGTLAWLTSPSTGLPVADPAAVKGFFEELGVGSEPQFFLSCELAQAGRLKILQGLSAVDLQSAAMSVVHYPSSTKTPHSGFAFALRA